MSNEAWYRVDIGRYGTGQIEELQVFKETDKMIYFIDGCERRAFKSSHDKLCVRTFDEAKAQSLRAMRGRRDILSRNIDYLRRDISEMEARDEY